MWYAFSIPSITRCRSIWIFSTQRDWVSEMQGIMQCETSDSCKLLKQNNPYLNLPRHHERRWLAWSPPGTSSSLDFWKKMNLKIWKENIYQILVPEITGNHNYRVIHKSILKQHKCTRNYWDFGLKCNCICKYTTSFCTFNGLLHICIAWLTCWYRNAPPLEKTWKNIGCSSKLISVISSTSRRPSWCICPLLQNKQSTGAV